MSDKNGFSQLIAQWITSIAISVVCCSILFVVFAGYLVDIRSSSNLMTIRIENLQEKVRQLSLDIVNLQKQALIGQKDALPPAPPPPPSAGVELSEPAPAEPPDMNKTDMNKPDMNKTETPPALPVPPGVVLPNAKAKPLPLPPAAKAPAPMPVQTPTPAAPIAPQPDGLSPAQ